MKRQREDQLGTATLGTDRSSGIGTRLYFSFGDFSVLRLGRKTVHLNAPALAVLHSIPRLEANSYVICGEKAGRHLVNLEKPWRRIRKAAKLDDVRLHDLRHSFASVAASGGQSLVVIGKMLGHSKPATTARYAHLADDPVKTASEAVGRHIASAMDIGRSGELVELPRSRRAAPTSPMYDGRATSRAGR